MGRVPWFVVVGVVVVAFGSSARAEGPLDSLLGGGTSAPAESRRNVVIENSDDPRTTPRGSVELFVEHARADEWGLAASWFPGGGSVAARSDAAKRLWRLLESSGGVRTAELSDAPEGRLDDGLPSDMEVVARVALDRGTDLLRMQRHDKHWAFTPQAITRLEEWEQGLSSAWLRGKVPDRLFQVGPRGLLYWQWLALPLLLLAAWVLGRLLALVLRAIIQRIAQRTTTTFDDQLLKELDGPLRLFSTSLVASLLSRLLVSGGDGLDFLVTLFRALDVVAFFWALLRTIDVAIAMARDSAFVRERPESRAMLQLGSKAAKVVVVIVGVIVALQFVGIPVTSLLAGLGLGGLAFALAAQKTVENLFGSVTLGVDQPFRPGDFVKIEDFLGHVESVGLRSTRIRTLDRTLITLPNGKLADMRIESYTARDRFRFLCLLGLTYDAKQPQLEALLVDLRALLAAHPKRVEESRVFLKQLGASSLDVELSAWIGVPEFAEFAAIREELLFAILGLVQKHGLSIAFPTQTLQHVWTGTPDKA